jgi:hypothetical protein
MAAKTASTGTSFQCFFSNDETASTATSSTTATYPFHLEVNKKSSFLLEAPTDDFGCEKQAHFMVEAIATSVQQHQRVPFVLGGFEIVTNSRNIEVYVTDDAEDEKETYITTCRGIKYIEGQDLWYKALLVIPGGPRSMKRLRLKLLSLRPPTATKSLFSFMKLKGRLPEVQQEYQSKTNLPKSSAESQGHNHNHAVPQQQASNYGPAPTTQPALTASDMSAALAGVGMMVQATEQRICQSMQSTVTDLGATVGTRLQGVEQVVMAQSKGLLDLQQVIVRQQIVMAQQAELLTQMQQQQVDLMETMHTLQETLSLRVTMTSALADEAPATSTDEDTGAQRPTAVVEDDGESSSEMQQQDSQSTTITTTTSVSSTTSVAHIPTEVMSTSEEDDDEDKPYSRPRAADDNEAKESEEALPATAEVDTDVDENVAVAAKTVHETVETDPSTAATNVMEDDKPPSRSRAIEVEERLELCQGEESQAEASRATILNDAITDVPDIGEEAEPTPAATSTTEGTPDDNNAITDSNTNNDEDSSPDRSRSELERPSTPEEFILEPPDKGVGMAASDEPPSPAEVDLIDFSLT